MTNQLLRDKLMNVRIKAVNQIWDRFQGDKCQKRWRSFKKPIGCILSDQEWKSMPAKEQLFILHDLEITRYIELDNSHDDVCADLREKESANEMCGGPVDFFDENDISLTDVEDNDYTDDLCDKNTIAELLRGDLND